MRLDPEVAAVVAALEAEPEPSVTEVPVAESRRIAADSFRRFAGEPEPVAAVEVRFIPGPTADLPVRIYRPAGGGARPVLVYFHGSGWVVHNIDSADVPLRALTNRAGCVVVAVNYQKAPEHPFPIPFDDAYAATCWVAAHAAEIGGDPDRVGVIGDSAGGNLAAAVCLKARDAGGPPLGLQVLIYPATVYGSDTASAARNADAPLLTRNDMGWFWQCYVPDPADRTNPLVSPLLASELSGLPRALVITAEYDPLLDDGERYAERLGDAGVAVTLHRYDGMVHGFFWLPGVVTAARALIDEIAATARDAFAIT